VNTSTHFVSINHSIQMYFLSSRNITVYTVYTSAQKAAREAYAHYTGRLNKQKNTNIYTNSGLSVCVLVTCTSPAETVEPIMSQFGFVDCCMSKEPCLRWGTFSGKRLSSLPSSTVNTFRCSIKMSYHKFIVIII